MVEAYISVIVTCNVCGKDTELGEHDYEDIASAIESSKKTLRGEGWKLDDGEELCPICNEGENNGN